MEQRLVVRRSFLGLHRRAPVELHRVVGQTRGFGVACRELRLRGDHLRKVLTEHPNDLPVQLAAGPFE